MGWGDRNLEQAERRSLAVVAEGSLAVEEEHHIDLAEEERRSLAERVGLRSLVGAGEPHSPAAVVDSRPVEEGRGCERVDRMLAVVVVEEEDSLAAEVGMGYAPAHRMVAAVGEGNPVALVVGILPVEEGTVLAEGIGLVEAARIPL